MQYVHEYRVNPLSGITKMPKGAELLSVRFNNPTVELLVYALVDLMEPMADRRIIPYDTARPIPDPRARFIGTATTNHGIVTHVFDFGEVEV